MKSGIHSPKLLLRRPYKLVLCCLVNLVVILFTVIEGVQFTESRAAMEAAMQSRVYTGTLTKTIEAEGYDGMRTYYSSTLPIGEDAVRILEESPYVDSVSSCEKRTARFGGKKKYVTGDAAQKCIFVGRASSDLMLSGAADNPMQRIQFRATYIAAGDPDTFYLGWSELHPLPSLSFSHYDPDLEIHRDERFFLYTSTPHATKENCRNIYVYNPPADMAMYYPGDFVMVREEPEDAALSDEEFAAKMIRAYGLEKTAEQLNDLVDMTSVVEIPTLDMLLPWRNNLMRIVSGRALTEEDAGQKVCMFPSAMLTAMQKKAGDTVLLAVSEHDLSGGSLSGIPDVGTEYDPADFGPMEEYTVVGTYANDSSGGLDRETMNFYMKSILIPRPADRPYEPVDMYHFSFTVHKDNYESYLFGTEPLLTEAGYTVVMARPDYADVEGQFEELRSGAIPTLLTAGLALTVGLAIASGSLVLFWLSDYSTERRLGAWKREAAGLYFRAYGIVSAVSLALSALAVFVIGKTKLVPFLAPENLSADSYGNMALFAAAELVLFALVAATAVLFIDRRKFGG